MLLVILKTKKLFYEEELQKENQKGFRVENVIKRKGDKLLNRKATTVFSTVGLIKKI